MDEIEQIKFSFGGVQVSPSLPEVPIDLANNPDIGGAYSSSNQFESEVLLNMSGSISLQLFVCGVERSSTRRLLILKYNQIQLVICVPPARPIF